MRSWLSIALALALSGCAVIKSYDREVYGTLDQAAAGNVDAALRMLEANNRASKDLLYYLDAKANPPPVQRYVNLK